MTLLKEYRKLLRIRVDYQGQNQYYFRVTNVEGYKDLTVRASPERMIRFFKNIQVKDTKTSPPSMRNLTYNAILQGIVDKTDNEVWVWSYLWKPSTRKIMMMEGKDVLSLRDLPDDILKYIHKMDKVRFFKGNNGKICIGYHWNKVKGEKYSNYEGGLVGAMVSNWDAAGECQRCGRKIVHEFFIFDPSNDTIRIVGKECMPQELGFEYIPPTVMTRIMRAQEKLAKDIENETVYLKRLYIDKFPVTKDPVALDRAVGNFHERGHNFKMGEDKITVYYNKETSDVVIYPSTWFNEVTECAYRSLGFEKFTADNFGRDLESKLKSIFPDFIASRFQER